VRRPRGPYAVASAVVLVALSGIGFLPLFGGPGYEQALATGLIVPSAAAIATAVDVARRSPSPLASVARGVVAGGGLAALALVTAIVHGARVGICEWWGALLYFALTAAAGSVIGGVWGAVAGEMVSAAARRGRIVRARRVTAAAVLLALGGPVLGVVVSVWRFLSSPMIFAFDPFVGYFSGTLYDTMIDAGTALLTYRLGSLATVSAAVLIASVLERDATRPFGLVLDLRSAGTRARAGLGVAAAVVSAALVVLGSKLGHFSTPASIAKDLGAEKHGVRCDVVYPSTTREQEALLLVKDCDEQVAAVEKALGAQGPARVRAYFFRDAEDKKRLMGAAHTYIAKPWREEVYLQVLAYPHPVLGHELAHVVAGSFGRGPFRIAGELGGLVPNPGLIEGVAVAASPDDEDLTDAQWALAMKKIGILPKMHTVFSLAFLGESSAKSYTLAGAFVSWVGSRYGMQVVRAWYGGGDIEKLTDKDWPTLDREFEEDLATRALPAEAESFAKAKFARPGIFGRKCPHVVDALRHEADVCRDTQRYAKAIELYREAIAKDAHDFAAQKEVAAVERRHGDREKGRAALEALATADEKKVPRTWRDRADEALADAQLIDGDYDGAAARYEALARRSVDEDVARTLEVKALGARDPAARPAVQALLLGDEKHGPDVFLGGVALGVWAAGAGGAGAGGGEAAGAAAPGGAARSPLPSPLVSYLIGRNLVGRGFYEAGVTHLDAALHGELPTARIARETLRQRAIAACALGDRAALDAVRARMNGAADPFAGAAGGRREATLRMVERCSR